MSIFNDICSDKLDEKISKCVLHFQAIVDQGMADNSRNRTTVPHLAWSINEAANKIIEEDPDYQNALASLQKIEDPRKARKHIYRQVNNNIVKYIYKYLAKLDQTGAINLSHANIEPSGQTLDVYLLPMYGISSEIRMAYDNLLANMFRPYKYQKDNKTYVEVSHRDDELSSPHPVFTLVEDDNIGSSVEIKTNLKFDGIELQNIDDERAWQKHEASDAEYFAKALSCIMPLHVYKGE